jgi:hypothetical protein
MPRAAKRKPEETADRAMQLSQLVEQLQHSIEQQHNLNKEKDDERDKILEQYQLLLKEREGAQANQLSKDSERENESLKKSVKCKQQFD